MVTDVAQINDIVVKQLFWVKQLLIININDIAEYNNIHILDKNKNGVFIDYEINKIMFPKPIFVNSKKLLLHKDTNYIVLNISEIEELYRQQHIENIKSVQSFFLN